MAFFLKHQSFIDNCELIVSLVVSNACPVNGKTVIVTAKITEQRDNEL